MKKDAGFIEFNTVLILFFIAALITGGVFYTSSAMNYSKADNNDFNNKLKADFLLDEIIEKMQTLCLYPFDDKNSEVITSICREYNTYNLEIKDVSSGFNLNFISDTDITDASITRLLFTDNSGSDFLTWRNLNGLTASKENWKELIKEEAWEYIVSYGWFNKDGLDSFAFRHISKTFLTTDIKKLFPLVNNFPRMNINMVNPEILRPLVTRSIFKIEKANEKADTLIKRLEAGSLTHSEIASIMRVTVNHPLMGYLGSKTAFWKLNFKMPSGLKVEAIVAAKPLKDGKVQEIENYKLIERSFL